MRNATELNYRILNRCLGAGRPENRVTAISKAPQKKCIGLTLPMNLERNFVSTLSDCTKMRQTRCAYSAS